MSAYRTLSVCISGMVAELGLAAIAGWLNLSDATASTIAFAIATLGGAQAWRSRGERVAQAQAETGHVVRRTPP